MTNGLPARFRAPPSTRFDVVVRLMLFWLGLAVPSSEAADIADDFSAGVGSWLTAPGWVLVEQATGQHIFRGDAAGDTFAQNGYLNLGASWRLEVEVRFRRYYADANRRGLAGFALFPSLGSGVQFEANLGHRTNDSVQLDTQWFNPANGVWSNVQQTGWTPNPSPAYRMHLFRAPGSDRLVLKLTATNGFSYRTETAPIPADVLNRMKVFGFRVNSAQVEYGNLRAITPYVPPAPPAITAQPESRTVTTGAAVSFRVAAAGAGPLTYQWYRGTARVTAATNDIYTIPKVLPAHAASFSVVVSNGETTATSSPAVLTVINATLRPAASAKTNGVSSDGLALEWTAPAGMGFRLQQTLDLLNWSDLTNAVGTGSTAGFIVAGATNEPRAFYRLLFP